LNLLSDNFSLPRGRPTGGTRGPQTSVGFPFLERFWFWFWFWLWLWSWFFACDGRPPTNGRRSVATLHAVCPCLKLPKSLRLARCIASAASVSVCPWAKRSSSARVTPGRKKLSQSGSSPNDSHGVAQRR